MPSKDKVLASIATAFVAVTFITTPANSCSDGAVRLVNGGDAYQGRVEACLNAQWGALCHTSWDNRDAVVVCRQLGFRGGLAFQNSRFGPATGLVHRVRALCSGYESTLHHCRRQPLQFSRCTRTAGVRCSSETIQTACSHGDVRLVDGEVPYEGRVEVCYQNTWQTVCDDNWSSLDAVVVCQQLGYSGGRAYTSSYFGRGSGLILLDEVRCSGFESELLDCRHNGLGVISFCDHAEDAGVRCSNEPAANCSNGDIRLVGGRVEYEGRVEVCYNSRWATVCDDNWSYLDAVVVCHQLGYSGGSAYSSSSFGYGTGLILLDEVRCSGFESELLGCRHSGVGVISFCNHAEDAGVRCSSEPAANCSNGDIRLVGGRDEYEGRVEMCYNNRWATVCHDNWGYLDAVVVCHQLGYSGGAAYTRSYFGRGSGLILLDEVRCSGFESELLGCRHNGLGVISFCDHAQDAGVRCSSEPAASCSNGDVRLVGGRDEYEGRVEMCYGKRWGTICHDNWGSKDAVVVCNQLGYSGGRYYTRSYFGRGSGLILLDEVRCTGYESSLLGCTHNGIATLSFCDHGQDAGVRCSVLPAEQCSNGSLRLVNGDVPHEGRVEICYRNRWGTVCHDSWSSNDALVVCRQLGYAGGSPFTRAYFGQGSGLIHLDEVRCSGSESSLLSCPHNGIDVISFCDHSEDAGVRCSIAA